MSRLETLKEQRSKIDLEIGVLEERRKNAELLKHLKANKNSVLDPERRFSDYGNNEIMHLLAFEMIDKDRASEHFVYLVMSAVSPKNFQGAWSNLEGLRGGELNLKDLTDEQFINLMRIWKIVNADQIRDLLDDVIKLLNKKVAESKTYGEALKESCEKSKAKATEKINFKVKYKGIVR